MYLSPGPAEAGGWVLRAHCNPVCSLISFWIRGQREQTARLLGLCGHQAVCPLPAGSRAPCSPERTPVPNFRSVGLRPINHAGVPAQEAAHPGCSRQAPAGGTFLGKCFSSETDRTSWDASLNYVTVTGRRGPPFIAGTVWVYRLSVVVPWVREDISQKLSEERHLLGPGLFPEVVPGQAVPAFAIATSLSGADALAGSWDSWPQP